MLIWHLRTIIPGPHLRFAAVLGILCSTGSIAGSSVCVIRNISSQVNRVQLIVFSSVATFILFIISIPFLHPYCYLVRHLEEKEVLNSPLHRLTYRPSNFFLFSSDISSSDSFYHSTTPTHPFGSSSSSLGHRVRFIERASKKHQKEIDEGRKQQPLCPSHKLPASPIETTTSRVPASVQKSRNGFAAQASWRGWMDACRPCHAVRQRHQTPFLLKP